MDNLDGTKCPFMCCCAVKKLLTHSLTHSLPPSCRGYNVMDILPSATACSSPLRMVDNPEQDLTTKTVSLCGSEAMPFNSSMPTSVPIAKTRTTNPLCLSRMASGIVFWRLMFEWPSLMNSAVLWTSLRLRFDSSICQSHTHGSTL